MRLIDADALEKMIRKRVYAIEVDDILAEIANAPTIDAVEVVRGEWIDDGFAHRCSNCGKVGVGIEYYNFCPNCGADMREREGE